MPNCAQHPARIAVATIHGRPCCPQCNAGIQSARMRVDRSVEPKECFVRFAGGDTWLPIAENSSAHWIAHQKNIRRSPSADTCLAGCVYQVSVLIRGLPIVPISQVQPGNLYVTPTEDYVGVVSRVEAGSGNGIPSRIFIRHDSSRHGGITESEFAVEFNGQGTFRR